MTPPGSPRRILELLRSEGVRPRKSLGQSFLYDTNFLDAIVRDAEIGPRDGVIEIGTGLGHLTARLAQAAGHVWTFELDPALYRISGGFLEAEGNVTKIEGDGADFARHVSSDRPIKVVSNLPYADYARFLLALLDSPLDVVAYTLLLQRDVYERLRAAPGTKAYGPLGALVQATCTIRFLRGAPARVFCPRPRVESALFRLVRSSRIPPLGFARTYTVLRRLFSQRRKVLVGGRRAEELSPFELLRLATSRAGSYAARGQRLDF